MVTRHTNYLRRVTGIAVSPASLTKLKGETAQLTAAVSPDNATYKTVTWSSSNTAVATVSASGLVTCVDGGGATITATAAAADGGGKTGTCALTVKVLATGVSVSPASVTKNKGEAVTLTATVTPSNTSNKAVTWSSSNTNIATVNTSGVVTCKAGGSATITATTTDGTAKKGTCALTVKVPVTGVTLNTTSITKDIGGTQQLTATVNPSDASNKAVSWSSSNTSVATVNTSGFVTCKAAGSATITVKTTDGNKTATCAVTVKPPPATSITLSPNSLYGAIPESFIITATVLPKTSVERNISWHIGYSSANATVTRLTANTARVDIVVLSGIYVEIVATCEGKTATCTVEADYFH